MEVGIIVVAVIAGAFAGLKIKKGRQEKKADAGKNEYQK